MNLCPTHQVVDSTHPWPQCIYCLAKAQQTQIDVLLVALKPLARAWKPGYEKFSPDTRPYALVLGTTYGEVCSAHALVEEVRHD